MWVSNIKNQYKRCNPEDAAESVSLYIHAFRSSAHKRKKNQAVCKTTWKWRGEKMITGPEWLVLNQIWKWSLLHLNSQFATFVSVLVSVTLFFQDKYCLCFSGTVIFKRHYAYSGFCMPFGSSVYLWLSQHSAKWTACPLITLFKGAFCSIMVS